MLECLAVSQSEDYCTELNSFLLVNCPFHGLHLASRGYSRAPMSTRMTIASMSAPKSRANGNSAGNSAEYPGSINDRSPSTRYVRGFPAAIAWSQVGISDTG